jgi:hypothetical protein
MRFMAFPLRAIESLKANPILKVLSITTVGDRKVASTPRPKQPVALRHRCFADQHGFAVFHRLLGEREPRFSHDEKC